MSVFLSSENLSLHRSVAPAGQEGSRPELAGILVDPARGVTVGCDGKRLVEITMPKVQKFPTQGVALANGGTKSFILPASVAQEILKALPKATGKKGDEPGPVAALAMAKAGEKPSFIVPNGAGRKTIAFDPVEGQYPTYSGKGGVFPEGAPIATAVVSAAQLKDTLTLAALDDVVTLHVFKASIVVMSQRTGDGAKSRALISGWRMTPIPYACDGGKAEPKAAEATLESKPAPAKPEAASAPKAAPAKVESPKPEAVKPEIQAPAQDREPQKAAFRGNHRGAPHWHRRYSPPNGGSRPTSPGGPTPGQRAFHTFLIKTRGGDLTLEDLAQTNVSEKIDELKAQPMVESSFVATWPQWRKLYLLLADAKAANETCVTVLNSLVDPKQTSSVIEEWLKKPAAQAA